MGAKILDGARMSSRGVDRGPSAKEEGAVKDWKHGGDEILAGDGKGAGLARTESESKARDILSDVDPWTAWLYKPHTLVVTLIGAGLLVYVDRLYSSFFTFLCRFHVLLIHVSKSRALKPI